MKAANATLLALLAGDPKTLVTADMFTFTLVDGTVLRYTSADISLTVGGNTFLPGGASGNPIFERGEISTELGTQVGQAEVEVSGIATDLLAGQAWMAAICSGKLDYATLLIQQFISSAWTDPSPGLVWMFGPGRVADVELDRLTAKITAKDPRELLDLNMPRNLYTPGCWHQLYDAGCTLNRAAFTVTGAVTNAVAPTRSAITTNLSAADNYFALGTLTFTSGTLSGLKRTVRSYLNANGAITFPIPTAVAPANGDTFSIVPGCDKQQATCGANSNIVFTASGSTLNATAHGLANGTAVVLSTTGALPAPLAVSTTYFIVNAAANTFQLAATLGGAAITLTNAGSGTNAVAANGKFGNIANFGGHGFIPIPETAL